MFVDVGALRILNPHIRAFIIIIIIVIVIIVIIIVIIIIIIIIIKERIACHPPHPDNQPFFPLPLNYAFSRPYKMCLQCPHFSTFNIICVKCYSRLVRLANEMMLDKMCCFICICNDGIFIFKLIHDCYIIARNILFFLSWNLLWL